MFVCFLCVVGTFSQHSVYEEVGWQTTCRSRSSLSTMWVLGKELVLLGSQHVPSCKPKISYLQKPVYLLTFQRHRLFHAFSVVNRALANIQLQALRIKMQVLFLRKISANRVSDDLQCSPFVFFHFISLIMTFEY